MVEPEQICDLHLHSTCSDGTDSPSQVVARARAKGLRAIALTDHDTIEGLDEFHREGKECGVETLNGVEITTEIGGREVHMLGYFFNASDTTLLDSLNEQASHRQERVGKMITKLQALGIPIEQSDVSKHSPSGTVGRPHVAQALVSLGVVKSIDEAFHKYLVRNASAFVDKPRIDSAAAIALIRASGGVAVLAHPGISRIDPSIPLLVDKGLQGIEVWHIRHDMKQNIKYMRLCEKYHLLATGGSDCHGQLKGEELMGKVRVPYERVQRLREYQQERR